MSESSAVLAGEQTLIREERRWRLVSAVIGVAAYRCWQYTGPDVPDWSQPALALYDVPVLLLAFSSTGGVLHALVRRKYPSASARAAALVPASICAWGAGFRQWPLSGHLTVAIAVGIVEAKEPANPRWLRTTALLPAAILVAIRTFRPQTALMGNRLYTAVACVAGLLIGIAAVSLAIRSRSPARSIGSAGSRRSFERQGPDIEGR